MLRANNVPSFVRAWQITIIVRNHLLDMGRTDPGPCQEHFQSMMRSEERGRRASALLTQWARSKSLTRHRGGGRASTHQVHHHTTQKYRPSSSAVPPLPTERADIAGASAAFISKSE